MYALAIDDTSGNIYFGLFSSGKIKTCNELGKNCTELLSNSSLLKNPWSIALDSKRRLANNVLEVTQSLVGVNVT